MTERPGPPSANESSPLHERGGLSVAHWQVVLEEVQAWISEIDTRPARYAQAVIQGEISDDHRQYLGSRDWDRLEFIFSVHDEQLNRVQQEVLDFARREVRYQFTIDDYYYQNVKFFRIFRDMLPHEFEYSSGKISWDAKTKSWSRYKYIPETYEDYGLAGFTVATEGYWDEFPPSFFQGPMKRRLAKFWLLKSSEIGDILHKSPGEIYSFARDNIAPQLLNKRLSKYLGNRASDYQLVGGWEKPIPQVA